MPFKLNAEILDDAVVRVAELAWGEPESDPVTDDAQVYIVDGDFGVVGGATGSLGRTPDGAVSQTWTVVHAVSGLQAGSGMNFSSPQDAIKSAEQMQDAMS